MKMAEYRVKFTGLVDYEYDNVYVDEYRWECPVCKLLSECDSYFFVDPVDEKIRCENCNTLFDLVSAEEDNHDYDVVLNK